MASESQKMLQKEEMLLGTSSESNRQLLHKNRLL